jgi:predicted lysophospholipase L1 biosynthesis ABC-type transport system permease subunit
LALTIVARTSITPEELIAPLTTEFAKFEPNQPLRRIRMMQAVLDSTMTDRRTSMWLLSSFAALALLLAAVGLQSVLAYMVRRRVREIDIRMALGAKVGDVLRIVMLDGLKPTVAGIVIGLTGAFVLSSYLKSLVYGIRTNDPYTFAGVTIVLAIVSLIACRMATDAPERSRTPQLCYSAVRTDRHLRAVKARQSESWKLLMVKRGGIPKDR